MRNLSRAFRRALWTGKRNYLAYADVTLSDNTVLNLTNSDIWFNGFSTDDAVSDDNSFTALGSAIIGSAEVTVNNISGQFSAYDFTNAKVVLYLGMYVTDTDDTERLEKFRVGTYTVDDTTYNGSTIKLSLLDNMEQFDRPYSLSTLSYPATLGAIVGDACTKCGVTFNSPNFPRYSYTVSNRPDDETTFREVISWAATIAGCFAKCDEYGRLVFKWFDQTTLENYAAELDGGTFNPWTDGELYDGGDLNTERGIHYISSIFSQNIAVDDVVITGVTIEVKDESDTAQDNIISYTSGTTGYVILIQDNPFITTSTAQTIVGWLGAQLNGLRFRKLNLSIASDPSIETGDVALVIDRKQNIYRALITRVSFSVNSEQDVVCGAETPSRNSATRFSAQTKSYVESRKLLKQEKTTREQAIEDLSDRLANSPGLYTTFITDSSTGATIFYLHDKPLLADSKIVWKMTAEAWGVTNDWQGTDAATTAANKWNAGMTIDGDVIARILNVIGINFDWGTGGTLTLGGQNNTNGLLIVLDASGNEVGRWSNAGINISKGLINIGNGAFQVNTAGAVTANSLTANSYVYVKGTSSSYFYLPYSSGSGSFELSSNGCKIVTPTDNIFIGEAVTSGYVNHKPVIIAVNNIEYPANRARLYDFGLMLDYGINGGSASYEYDEIVMYKPIGSTNYSYFNVDYDNGIQGNKLTISGTKSRVVETKDYADRLLYCYETPSPLFGDVGEGVIAEDGYCYVQIDPILAETINTNQYQVFLQKYGDGDCYIKKRHPTYFIVCGTPNMSFGWELKAKQVDFDQLRLDKQTETVDISNQIDYGIDAINHIKEIQREREVTE